MKIEPTEASRSTRGIEAGSRTTPRTSSNADRTSIPPIPWQGQLKLRNPHALCYVNAGIISVLYAMEQALHAPAGLAFLFNLCRKAAEKEVQFLLIQSNRFRALTPAWTFDNNQRDSAEYLHALLQDGSHLALRWLSRYRAPEGIRVRQQGGAPIPIPLRRAGTLQQMINCWHQDGDIHALFEHGPLICLQLNRYLLGGKNMASVHFENAVQVPVFTQGLEVEWFAYKPVAGILHRGRLTESGHYQALLKVRHLWFQTEDHVCARPVAINAVQRSNIYVIWLMRSRAQASDQC